MNFIKSNAFFFLVFTFHLCSVILEWNNAAVYSKPFLLISLIVYFVKNAIYSHLILAALVFSLMGDVLLIFQERHTLFFITGLIAFLIAHICYTIYFLQLKKIGRYNRWNWAYIMGSFIYGFFLILLLFPELGELKIPVSIYALVICIMLISAIHVWLTYRSRPTFWLFAGALLFVWSDSILAINKFYSSFTGASFLIMLLYGLAQLCIVTGVVQHSTNIKALEIKDKR